MGVCQIILPLTPLNSMDKQHPQTVARRVLSVAYGSLSDSDSTLLRHDLDAHSFQPITAYGVSCWFVL